MVPAILEPFAQPHGVCELKDWRKNFGCCLRDRGCGAIGMAEGSALRSRRWVRCQFADARRCSSCFPQQAAEIAWVEGNVTEMPFPSGDFDVVLCQHGLQYFPERSAALNQMHRVLNAAGRLIASVWRPITFNAGHSVFADVLERL